MATRDDHRMVETPTEARQGEPGPSVLALLAVSLGLAVLVLAVVWFVFFRTLMRPGWSDPRGGVKHTLIPLAGGGTPHRLVKRFYYGATGEGLKVVPVFSMAQATLRRRSATDRRARP